MADLFQAPIDDTYKCPTMDTFDWPELNGPITMDTENHDPHLKTRGSGWAYDRLGRDGGKIIGIAIKADDFHEYLPIGHVSGNMDPLKVKRWLSAQLTKDDTQPKIFANAMYDAGWYAAEGIEMSGPIEDVMYQAPLLNENRIAYSLDRLGKDDLGFGKDERLLLAEAKKLGLKNTKKDPVKAHLMRFNPDIVGIYARQDVQVTKGLWDHYTPLIAEQDLTRVYQLETDLIPMHIAMRLRGVRVNVAEAEKQQKILLVAEREAKNFIKSETGIQVESWDNAEEVSRVFDKLGISYGRTDKTDQPSITQSWLKSLRHPVADAVLLGRKVNNNRTTFIEGAILNLQERGRVHPSFNQLKRADDQGSVVGKETKSGNKGAISGRYSSSNPNFQNVPSPEKDDPDADFQLGMLVRSMFLPEEGDQWHVMDYSSQEPRGIIHFAELTNCRMASEVADRYRADPDTDFHMENAKLIMSAKPDFAVSVQAARKPCKIIGLGIAYGMGAGKLAFSLGLPYTMSVWLKNGEEIPIMKSGPEGIEIINTFDEQAPYIRELATKCQNRVKSRGVIVTPTGRTFHFPKDETGRYMWLNKALNRLIQGTSADMTKLAMRELWRAGIMPLGTVHDEIDISSRDPKIVRQAQIIMENALKFTIPNRVDIGTGDNWGIAASKQGNANYEKFRLAA